MAQVKMGDTVRVHYTGTLDDGTVFDSSVDRTPLEFTCGEGQLISGFEQAILGMQPGESKKVAIPASEAYGPRHEEMIMTVDRGEFPEDISPEVGQMLQVEQPDGERAILIVAEVCDSCVTLDGNHPLAGMDLNFEIQVLEILPSH